MPIYTVTSPLGTTQHILPHKDYYITSAVSLSKHAAMGHLREFGYTDIADAAFDHHMNALDFNMAMRIIRKDKEATNG